MAWRSGWKDLSFEKKLTIVGAPLLVAILTGLVITPLSSYLTNRDTTRLEVVDLEPRDAPEQLVDEPYEPPSVDVLVRNTGDLVSVVSGTTLEILDYGLLAICEAGGELTASASYDAILPTGQDAINSSVDVPVSQEIKTGEADRFRFRLAVPQSRVKDGAHLYRVRLLLHHDDSANPLDAGTFIVSIPIAVNDWYFDEEFVAQGDQCYTQNAETYRRFSTLAGERSVGMTTPVLR